MKKGLTLFLLGLTLAGAAQANLKDEYKKALYEWEKRFSAAARLKEQPLYIGESRQALKYFEEDPNASP